MKGNAFRRGTMVFSRYRIIEEIGSGSFGCVYSAEDIRDSSIVAIKAEKCSIHHPQLEGEYKIYLRLKGAPNFPKVYEYGRFEDYFVLVMELLGKSIENKFQHSRQSLSVKTVLMLADQMLCALEHLHNCGFIHRDLKPDNFVLGTGKNSNVLYLIDFGLSSEYRSPTTLKHVKEESGLSLIGTARYASINALRGRQQSRRDDMESLGYILFYLLRGSLPWQGLPAKTFEQKNARIASVKERTTPQQLCQGFPSQFAQFLIDAKELEFTEEPQYSKYRQMFRDLMLRNRFAYDYKYDWTINVCPPPPMPHSISPRNQIPRTAAGKRGMKSFVQWQGGCQQKCSPRHFSNPTPPPPLPLSREHRALMTARQSKDICIPRDMHRVMTPRYGDEQVFPHEIRKVMTPRNRDINKFRNFQCRRIPLGIY